MHHAVDTIKNYIVSNQYNSRISHPTPKVSLKILTKNKQRKKNHLCALITLFFKMEAIHIRRQRFY